MNIDLFIVVGFIVLTLAVGLGHGKKIKTIQDYALGGRNFSTIALVIMDASALSSTHDGTSTIFILAGRSKRG